MSKILKPSQKDRCTGCELCVFEAQRQLKKVSLEESLIRIFRKKLPETQKVGFDIEIDPRINVLDLEKIVQICQKNVFEYIEKTEND